MPEGFLSSEEYDEQAHKLYNDGDYEGALEMLMGAACSAQSIRDKTNCRLLMAKICLRAGKANLALPIAEEINELVNSLSLDKWESPIWVAEVTDTLYQCMSASDDFDEYKAKELLTKICTTDITKAMQYSSD